MRIETADTAPLILYSAPHRFTDYLRLCFVLPLDEPTATAASLLTSLLKHGTRRFPSNLALMRALEEHYGILVSLDTYRKGDILIFKASLTAPDATRISDGPSLRRTFVRLFAEILLEPNTPNGRFPHNIFQLERHNHLRLLQSLPNHRHAYSRHRFEQHLFAGEPAATLPDGSPTICRDLNQASVLSILHSIQNDAPLLAFAFGHFNKEELCQEIAALLHNKRKRPVERTFLREARDEPLTVMETLEGLEQTHIWLGWRAKVGFCSPDIAALALGVAIYGSGFVSRLFRRVREEMGLAYDASATYIRTKGVVVASAAVHPGRHKEVVEAMLREFSDLACGNIKGEEFEMSKRVLLEQLRASCDSAGFLADFYTTTLLFGSEEEIRRHGLEALITQIERLKVDDVAAALSHFRPDTIYILAPERKR